MNTTKKYQDIAVSTLFFAGTLGFMFGEFIFSTVFFATAFFVSNVVRSNHAQF